MSPKIVSGITEQYYHTFPSELDIISTSPTRDAIFQYLSQISYTDFPEFVLDILIKVEGHQPIDITEGTGDEKRDIYTTNRDGKKCLIQCKHTEKIEGKYNGDEVDLMVSACLRKNCRAAIFVTNGDLTPQAKNYINDQEYLRGWPENGDTLEIEYWNGYHIWEKVKNNQDILNKWFSGMGQSHGLRSFKFDVSFLRMPFLTRLVSVDMEQILQHLLDQGIIAKTDKEIEFTSMLDGMIQIKIQKWYQFAGNLDLNLNTSDTDVQFWHTPLFALQIEVNMPDTQEKYSPQLIKERILNHLFDSVSSLSLLDQWWHLLVSQAKAFVYLHDIGEPRQMELDGSRSFINIDGKIITEHSYCTLTGPEMKLKPGQDDEEAIWIYGSGEVECVQFFEQSLHPMETYRYQQVQLDRVEEMKTYHFRAAEQIENSQAMRIRKVLPGNWIGMTYNENTFIWCFPPTTPEDKVQYIETKLQVMGIQVLQVREETVSRILEDISKDIPPVQAITITELNLASTPINLLRRGFWLHKDIASKSELDIDKALELVKYKFLYEHEQGFDNLMGVEHLETHSSEIPNMLMDFYSLRCDRMLDISIVADPIVVSWRFSPRSLESSHDLIIGAMTEFEKLCSELKQIVQP